MKADYSDLKNQLRICLNEENIGTRKLLVCN